MTSTNLDANMLTVRPKSLSAKSLIKRAVLGLFILFVGTFISVWLYDATIKAEATNTSNVVIVSQPTSVT